MPETKTFKNPYKVVLDHGYEIPHWNIYTLDGAGAFSEDEWDMEVTFTRKALKLVPGEQYRHTNKYIGDQTVTVIHVHDGMVWYEDEDGDYYIGAGTDFEVLD